LGSSTEESEREQVIEHPDWQEIEAAYEAKYQLANALREQESNRKRIKASNVIGTIVAGIVICAALFELIKW
jgi:hypothetical protein